ncbi:MAG TPA: PaaI family thioesterase [Clostridiales bacterium]|jgi:acyl-coenzyme A thioesterase PaaI-like protein|nr:PaaI family thioesterase [Clostridiales bacterium]
MKHLDELLEQDKFEKGIRRILEIINKENGQVNQLMTVQFVSCSEIERTITLEFPVMEWQLNSNRVMHGGIVSTAFDIAMGVFANYLNRAVTGNITVNFIKPVPVNDSLIITSKVTSSGKRLTTLSAEGRLKSSGIIAGTAVATFANIS